MIQYHNVLQSPLFKRFVRTKLFDRGSLLNRLLHAWLDMRNIGRRLPGSPEALRESAFYKQWWYYSVELLPGITTRGAFAAEWPMLPRIMMRNCDLTGAECLDIGSVEGLMPVLMCRQGAKKVIATNPHLYNYEKMLAIRKCYKANFGFRQIGSLYNLSDKLRGGFDFINLSGVLYHVFSPMHVLAGLRPLLKRNGLMIVSTNVVNRSDYTMEFNERGKLQREDTTFWYLTIPLFDYLLRYFALLPIDCLYHPYTPENQVISEAGAVHSHYVPGLETGYLSVVCRATDEPSFEAEDSWALGSIEDSYESILLCDRNRMHGQQISKIQYRRDSDDRFMTPDKRSIDLFKAVQQMKPMLHAEEPHDSHTFRLSDRI